MRARPAFTASRLDSMPTANVATTGMPKPAIRAGSSTAATGVRARVPKNSTGRAKLLTKAVRAAVASPPNTRNRPARKPAKITPKIGRATLKMACMVTLP